jgi:hypothetical protein
MTKHNIESEYCAKIEENITWIIGWVDKVIIGFLRAFSKHINEDTAVMNNGVYFGILY